MPDKIPGIYTFQFWLLCISSFLFFASFNMIIPELPDFLSSLGGSEYKGLIISLFTLTAGFSRPFSGKLADRIGRLKVMIFGALISALCGYLYSFVYTVSAFLFLRFFHGFSTGFTPTGTSAYVADIVPADRRGEAMGIIGFAGSMGMAGGPTLGSYITSWLSLDHLFYISSFSAFLSVAILSGMKETLEKRESFSPGLLKIKWKDVFEPRVFAPSVVTLLSLFSFGIILTIIPDYSVHVGISNKGLFFTYFTLASLLVRLIAGKASDRFGRVIILKISTLSLAVAMLLIAFSNSVTMFIISAVTFGFAIGMNSPTLFAWTIDLGLENHRGKALATMFIALEIGIGMGAIVAGFLYSNKVENFPQTFICGAMAAFLAFIFLQVREKNPR